MEIESFDSFDDMMRRLQEQMKAADARVEPWQAAIKPDDYFFRNSGYGFPIYGQVLKEDEPREPHVRHYRLCNCYSMACIEGEMGDVHVSSIERIISEAEFEEARSQGWNPEANKNL